MIRAPLQIREGLFGSCARRTVNSAGTTEHAVFGQFVGSRSPGWHRKVVNGLPLDVESGARENAVAILDVTGHDPLQIKFVGGTGWLDAEKSAVFDAFGVEPVDHIVATRVAAVTLGDREVTARQSKSEHHSQRKGSHV